PASGLRIIIPCAEAHQPGVGDAGHLWVTSEEFFASRNVLEQLAGVLYHVEHSRFIIEHASVDFSPQIRHYGSIEHRFGGWSAG
ncbi:MAG: hypothetical protein ABTR27_11780, partial [Candidatus Competibacter phosphatis]